MTTTTVDAGATSPESYAAADRVRAAMAESSEKYVMQSPFTMKLQDGTLSRAALREFWLNWSQYVAEVNSIIQCAYQRHIGFFVQNLDLMAAFADKVADELVHPRPPGHLLVVWEQGEIFGLKREEMISYRMLAGCRALLEYKRGLLYEGTMGEFWAAISTEEHFGYWSGTFRQSLLRMGFSADEVPYFAIHEEADLSVHEGGVMAHADVNREVLARMIEQGYGVCRPGFSLEYAARVSAELKGIFFRSVLERVGEC